MYYIPLFVLMVFSLFEIMRGDRKNRLFRFAVLGLTLMLCLRYGQGTDYFGYMTNYDTVDTHSEIGFLFISQFCRRIGVSYELFVAFVSLFQMVCLYRAICLYSPIKNLSLLLFYPTLFLTYCFSAMRQGIVITFFLGFMLRWLEEDKWIKYLIACVAVITIHSASWVLVPLVVIKKINTKWLYRGILIAAGLGMFIYFTPAEWFSFIEIGAVQYYVDAISISVMGFAERVAMFAVITYFVWRQNKENKNERLNFLYKVYICGFIISVAFFPWHMLSSRLGAMMKATEILLLPILINEGKHLHKAIIAFLFVYVTVMTTKNLRSYINQGSYVECNVLTYPYLNVLDKEKAREVRKLGWEGYKSALEGYKKAHNIP